jgi:hypothetical protein
MAMEDIDEDPLVTPALLAVAVSPPCDADSLSKDDNDEDVSVVSTTLVVLRVPSVAFNFESFSNDNLWKISFIVGLFLGFLVRHCCTRLSTSFASSMEYLHG